MTLLEKKHQAYESLLRITEEMERAVLNGDYDALEEMTVSRDNVIKGITAIDEDMKILPNSVFSNGDTSFPPLLKGGEGGFEVEMAEIMALIHRIAGINERLISRVSDRLHDVERELGKLRKSAVVVAEYGKISNL